MGQADEVRVVVLYGKDGRSRSERRYLIVSQRHKIAASDLRRIGRHWDISVVPEGLVDWTR